jgi:hypothetical protein
MIKERVMDAKHIGSNFDDFLAEEAILDECNALAMKRVIAWQIEQENEGVRELEILNVPIKKGRDKGEERRGMPRNAC